MSDDRRWLLKNLIRVEHEMTRDYGQIEARAWYIIKNSVDGNGSDFV